MNTHSQEVLAVRPISCLLLALGLSVQPAAADQSRLAQVLMAQPEATQQRYHYRHPLETLSFFGVEPGMTVVEALPGRGWYSRILVDYLGPEGHLIGVDYAPDLYRKFGFYSDEMVRAKETWVVDWVATAGGWRGAEGARVSAFTFGAMPDSARGTADMVLFIRALHNLARFENDGGYLTTALQNAVAALKPGGILGVVQHQAREEKPKAWANGARGYLKQSFVIEQMQNAGLEFVGESAVNHNDEDRPGADDVVWRLPPSLRSGDKDAGTSLRHLSVGESNRMTLKFRKPSD